MINNKNIDNKTISGLHVTKNGRW